MGHILGAEHNREVEDGGLVNDFSYGYLLKGSRMLTVMAYFSGSFSQWIPYFSNDDMKANGVQMGTARDDNRRQLINARFSVAGYGDESGTCSGGGSGSNGGGGEGSGGGTASCGNVYDDGKCASWVRHGYCTRSYVKFMQENCKKACGLCSARCVDKKSSCPFWARKEYCTRRYVGYMRANCKKSCNLGC